MSDIVALTSAALVVAHPGHEMRIHGWLESVQPRVFVLTDGSGRSGQSRIPATSALLAGIGIEPGSIYGRFLDLTIYKAILNREFDVFIRLVEELAEAFVYERLGYVVGDAAEGYNSTHDICRLIINAALEVSKRMSGREIANYDFPVVSQPDTCPEALRTRAIWIDLDESAFARKLAAAQKYYPELLAEVSSALSGTGNGPLQTYLDRSNMLSAEINKTGLNMFRVECLRPVDNAAWSNSFLEEPPFYERHSEKLVAAGYYDQVIRYRDHVLPIAEALWRHVEGDY